jgi:formylmethanofuran dehydrogenase subunit E
MEDNRTIWLQGFFDDVEPISLSDPLSEVLGAQKKGDPLVFRYTDAVKFAGHSCPSVSGAYRLTVLALKALYGDEVPERGSIRVLIKGGPDQLAYGPQSQVITLITGAAGVTGFKGLKRRFSRKGKLVFDTGDFQLNTFIFLRDDTGAAVRVTFNPDKVPEDPDLSSLMPRVVEGTASDNEKKKFARLWQERVRKILLDYNSYPGLFEVEVLEGFEFPKEATEGTKE